MKLFGYERIFCEICCLIVQLETQCMHERLSEKVWNEKEHVLDYFFIVIVVIFFVKAHCEVL
jgi:hypothetical protein